MNNKIIDGMRKEGKPFRNIMLFGYIFAILMPLSIYLMNNDKYSDKDKYLFYVVCTRAQHCLTIYNQKTLKKSSH